MAESTKKAPKRARIILGIVIAILAALVIAAACWVNDYYHADEAALGGVAACNYVGQHAGDFKGVALLASFPANDLSSYGGNVITLVGSEDRVINRAKLEGASTLLPGDAESIAIEGGNHAGFGNYGEQDGDGAATISSEQQQEEAVDAIEALVKAA